MQGPRTTFIYLAVVFGLLVIPRALQRFRLPAPLTCFAFGIIVAGFLAGSLALVFGPTWWLFWAGGAVAVLGLLVMLTTDTFEDWY